jgi:hypothetical protein
LIIPHDQRYDRRTTTLKTRIIFSACESSALTYPVINRSNSPGVA